MKPQDIRTGYQELLRRYHEGEIDWKTFEAGLLEMKNVRAAMKSTWEAEGVEMGGSPDTQEFQRALDDHPSTGSHSGSRGTSSGTTKRRVVFNAEGLPGTKTFDSGIHARSGSGIFRAHHADFRNAANAQAAHMQPGSILGESYTLERPLGYGTLGETWRALDRASGRSLVLKLIPKEFQEDPRNNALVRNEFRMITGLRGNHICPLYRIGLDDTYGSYLVSAFLEAVPLNEYYEHYIRNFSTFPFNALIRIAWPVAQSLDLAHAKSIVHRNLKMQNVLIGERCGVQVTDFTIPDLIRERLRETDNILVGEGDDLPESLLYRAPEIGEGEAPTAKSDQFALAVIVYRLLAGKLPFLGKTEAELKECIRSKDPAPIADYADSINEVLAKALAPNPKKRFDSCLAFLRVLIDAHKQGPHFVLSPETLRKAGKGARFGILPLLFGTAVPLPKEVAADKSIPSWPFKEQPSADNMETMHGETVFEGQAYPYRNWTARQLLLASSVAGAIVVAVFGVLALGDILSHVIPGNDTPPPVYAGNVSGEAGGSGGTASPGAATGAGSPVADSPDAEQDYPSVKTSNASGRRETDSAKASPDTPPLTQAELSQLMDRAKRNNIEALRRLGEIYLNGNGVPKNEAYAVRWFQHAAEIGDAESCFQLGRCHQLGLGVEQNAKTAVSWYERGAEKDDANCLFQLGRCYENGFGIASNPAQAREFFQRAADRGHAQAKRKLNVPAP